jgi:DNA polymerase-4
LIEPLSFGETYLDVTANKKRESSASLLAEEIRLQFFNEVGLTASAGISLNKFVAKLCDYNTNGQKMRIQMRFYPLEVLLIRKFHEWKVTMKMYHQVFYWFEAAQ